MDTARFWAALGPAVLSRRRRPSSTRRQRPSNLRRRTGRSVQLVGPALLLVRAQAQRGGQLADQVGELPDLLDIDGIAVDLGDVRACDRHRARRVADPGLMFLIVVRGPLGMNLRPWWS